MVFWKFDSNGDEKWEKKIWILISTPMDMKNEMFYQFFTGWWAILKEVKRIIVDEFKRKICWKIYQISVEKFAKFLWANSQNFQWANLQSFCGKIYKTSVGKFTLFLWKNLQNFCRKIYKISVGKFTKFLWENLQKL